MVYATLGSTISSFRAGILYRKAAMTTRKYRNTKLQNRLAKAFMKLE